MFLFGDKTKMPEPEKALPGRDQPIPTAEILARNAARGDNDGALDGQGLQGFVGDSQVLIDDFAPVDQLLSPAR